MSRSITNFGMVHSFRVRSDDVQRFAIGRTLDDVVSIAHFERHGHDRDA